MNDGLTKRIDAKDGLDFYHQLAAFSYDAYLKFGFGVVVLSEKAGFTKYQDGRVVGMARYEPYFSDNPDDELVSPEVIAMLNKYDPATEIVLLMISGDGKANCYQITAQQLGASPREQAELTAKTNSYLSWLPGQVLKLNDPIDAISPGHYAFVEVRETKMVLKSVEQNPDDDELSLSDEEVLLHIDYVEMFTPIIGVNLRSIA